MSYCQEFLNSDPLLIVLCSFDMKYFSAAYIQYLWDEIAQVIKSCKLGSINQVKVDNESNSQLGSQWNSQSVNHFIPSYIKT